MSDQSMRETMEAAFEEDEKQQEEIVDEQPGGDNVEETPEVEAQETEDASGGDIEGASNEQPTEQPAAEGAGESEQPAAEPVKGPVSWSPKLREEFSKLPANIQAQINKRESEINKFQNDGAESRKFGDRMGQALSPYQSVMAAHGTNDPIQAVQGLMDTATTLQMGTPQQKAQKIAEMIGHYGIDIQTLDGMLAGNPASSPEQNQLEQMLEQKLAPMNTFMNNVQQQQQQSHFAMQNDVNTEVTKFEQSAEFINDVRNDMADLLDMAAKRGQEMSLQQAYDKAVTLHPEISSVLAQRQKDEALINGQNKLNQKKTAASSISGNRVGGNGEGKVDDSIAGLLNQAWDDQQHG